MKSNFVRIRQRPQRRLEADAAHLLPHFAGRFQALAINHDDIGTDRGIFGNIARVVTGNFDLVTLGANPFKERARLLAIAVVKGAIEVVVDQGDNLEQFLERNLDLGDACGNM